MSYEEIIRAWRDRGFRRNLEGAGAELPENPAGVVELDDEALGEMGGGICYSFDNCQVSWCTTEGNPFTLGSCCAEPPGGGTTLSANGMCPSGAGTSGCTCYWG